MKTIGITRRIDELGRVVIPKEIRKNMHIKSGDLLEIYLNNEQTITLKKHSFFSKNEGFLWAFIDTLSRKINSNIFIVSQDEIVFSNLKNLLHLKVNATSNNIVMDNYELSSDSKIYELIPNGDLVGYLIIEPRDKNIDKHFNLISFSLLFLETYLENE